MQVGAMTFETVLEVGTTAIDGVVPSVGSSTTTSGDGDVLKVVMGCHGHGALGQVPLSLR
jgi:hypothetical protein